MQPLHHGASELLRRSYAVSIYKVEDVGQTGGGWIKAWINLMVVAVLNPFHLWPGEL